MIKNVEGVIVAYDKGYRVINGEVMSPFTGQPRVLSIHNNDTGRYKIARFSVGGQHNRHKYSVNVHQLAAYQKYGNVIFAEDVLVRHLDGDSLNNKDENIAIGSHSDNAMDKTKEARIKQAIMASTHIRKFPDVEMERIRAKRSEGATYKDLMTEFNISSKGTLHHILNNNYVTKV